MGDRQKLLELELKLLEGMKKLMSKWMRLLNLRSGERPQAARPLWNLWTVDTGEVEDDDVKID